MSARELALTVESKTGRAPLSVAIDKLVVAGWTGRDAAARDHHIAELEAVGIARPASTPIFYRVGAARLTTADRIEVSGGESSGEVEFIVMAAGGKTYVGVGSEHTDRKVETYSVTVSKQMCDKPIAAVVWPLDEIAGHWDRMILRAFATIDGVRVLYQEGTLDAILPLADLIRGGFGGAAIPDGCAMFGGTFAAKGGIRPASRFEYELEDPVLTRVIRGGYDIVELPILG